MNVVLPDQKPTISSTLSQAMQSLLTLTASRKSIVGAIAMLIVGGIYFFDHTDPASKSSAMMSVAGIAISIIHAIGAEDAGSKASMSIHLHNSQTPDISFGESPDHATSNGGTTQ